MVIRFSESDYFRNLCGVLEFGIIFVDIKEGFDLVHGTTRGMPCFLVHGTLEFKVDHA